MRQNLKPGSPPDGLPKGIMRTIERFADYLGKMALAAQIAGLVAFFNPTGGFTSTGAFALFGVGFSTFMVAMLLYYVVDTSQEKEDI